MRQVPGCPILSLVLSALTMEKPSMANIVEADGDIQESREREVTDLKLIQSQVLGEDHVVKKRKRPKGPNPLSCKKKQKKMPDVIQEKNSKKKRHRKRVKPTLPKHVRDLLQQN